MILFNLIKSKYFIALLVVLVLSVIGYKVYWHIYNIGYQACNEQFLEYKNAQAVKTLELQNEYDRQKEKYQAQTEDLVAQIGKNQESYNKKLIAIESDYSGKLLQSESRASLYKQLSRTSKCSNNDLADYSARLDKTVTEGRQLVAQLRELIELRDSQLRELGKQLQLMTGKNNAGN